MSDLMFYEAKKITVIYAFIRQSDDDTADKAYSERRKYAGILTLDYKTPEFVYISGMLKSFTDRVNDSIVSDFFQFLKSKGVKRIEYERNGKLIEEVI